MQCHLMDVLIMLFAHLQITNQDNVIYIYILVIGYLGFEHVKGDRDSSGQRRVCSDHV